MVYTMLKTILLLKEENGYRIVQFKLIKLSRENSDLTVKIGCIVSLEYTSNGNVKSETRSIGVSDSSFKDISANRKAYMEDRANTVEHISLAIEKQPED